MKVKHTKHYLLLSGILLFGIVRTASAGNDFSFGFEQQNDPFAAIKKATQGMGRTNQEEGSEQDINDIMERVKANEGQPPQYVVGIRNENTNSSMWRSNSSRGSIIAPVVPYGVSSVSEDDSDPIFDKAAAQKKTLKDPKTIMIPKKME